MAENYTNSDYALNKNSKGIVYRFADQIVEISLSDYLDENPGKTEADFAELKALSDRDYFEQDRKSYRQTWKDISFHKMDNVAACAAPSPEDDILERPQRGEKKKLRRVLAKQALDKLSEFQRRRYIQYYVFGLTEQKIAEKEGATQQAVSKSLCWAEKKIKKFLSAAKK